MSEKAELFGDREIRIERVFDAPVGLVWRAWTDVQHVSNWWGPRGFSTKTHSHDFKPGGTWKFVMIGPDGREYENKVTFLEITHESKIVYKHGGVGDTERVTFTATVEFVALSERRTRLTKRLVFPTAGERDFCANTYGAVEGLTDTMTRLAEFAATLGNTSKPFTIGREFDAPRELVWRAWTDEKEMAKWFGPKGVETVESRMEFRPGGRYRYAMKPPEGDVMWGMWRFREITPPDRLVFVVSFTDPDGRIIHHPMNPTWPLELLTTVTFEARGHRTYVTVRWEAINATPEEIKTFDENHPSMQGGWSGTFERFESYLNNK